MINFGGNGDLFFEQMFAKQAQYLLHKKLKFKDTFCPYNDTKIPFAFMLYDPADHFMALTIFNKLVQLLCAAVIKLKKESVVEIANLIWIENGVITLDHPFGFERFEAIGYDLT